MDITYSMGLNRKTINKKSYSSRKYRIEVEVYDDNTAFVEVAAKRKYKHGAYRWWRTTKKHGNKMLRRFGTAHFLADYAKDYADYYDCLDRLQHSHCAKKWFKRVMQPYLDLHHF